LVGKLGFRKKLPPKSSQYAKIAPLHINEHPSSKNFPPKKSQENRKFPLTKSRKYAIIIVEGKSKGFSRITKIFVTFALRQKGNTKWQSQLN
jgi:hypothetical protein